MASGFMMIHERYPVPVPVIHRSLGGQPLRFEPHRTEGEQRAVQPHPARLLVVDDENGPRQALRMLLKEEYCVHMASGVDAALEILEQEPVDVIITDIRMPNRSGLELLREVKQGYPDIQVIILTGYGQLESAMEAIECGAFAYIEKPFDSAVMLEKVHCSVEKRRQEQSRRALEYLAVEANRFETLGHLVSGSLHDLGTPLSVIGTNLEMLLSNPERPDLVKRLDSMRSQVKHCNDLVRTTLNFVRRAPETMAELDLNAVVEACLDVAKPFLMGHQVVAETEFSDERIVCTGDIVMVRQAVLNLIYNAAQAMQDQEAPRWLRVRTWNEEGCACLAVEDNGPGVPAETREQIFEALFTTKGKHGTGLGLAVVKNVMQRHCGRVSLAETEGRGARFVLQFSKGAVAQSS